MERNLQTFEVFLYYVSFIVYTTVSKQLAQARYLSSISFACMSRTKATLDIAMRSHQHALTVLHTIVWNRVVTLPKTLASRTVNYVPLCRGIFVALFLWSFSAMHKRSCIKLHRFAPTCLEKRPSISVSSMGLDIALTINRSTFSG